MSKELIQLLVKNHGVDEDKAKTAIGVVLLRGKRRMDPADFAKITAIDPMLDVLVKKAPQMDVHPLHSWTSKLYPTVLEFIKNKAGAETAETFDASLFLDPRP